jgi:hypothetical protein
MLLRKVASDPLWVPIAEEQGGLVCRRQLLELGLTRTQAATNVDNGRWQRVHPGVYATFTGTLDPVQHVWAALLHAGRGAVACCSTALWLFRVLDEQPDPLHVSIPEARRVEPVPGVRLHRRRALNRPETPVHPAAVPPRIRIEESLLDECAVRCEADVVGLVLRATQRRRTTPGRIAGALSTRAYQPKRSLIRDVLAEAEAGVASPLELHYRRRVEVAHRLPVGRRNLLDVDEQGRRRYRDVEYERWGPGRRTGRPGGAPHGPSLPRSAPGQPGDGHRTDRAPLRLARCGRRAMRRRRSGWVGVAAARMERLGRSMRRGMSDPTAQRARLSPLAGRAAEHQQAPDLPKFRRQPRPPITRARCGLATPRAEHQQAPDPPKFRRHPRPPITRARSDLATPPAEHQQAPDPPKFRRHWATHQVRGCTPTRPTPITQRR